MNPQRAGPRPSYCTTAMGKDVLGRVAADDAGLTTLAWPRQSDWRGRAIAVSDGDLQLLATALAHNTNLRVLDFRDQTAITDEGVRLLLPGLRSSYVRYITIYRKRENANGRRTVIERLPRVSQLAEDALRQVCQETDLRIVRADAAGLLREGLSELSLSSLTRHAGPACVTVPNAKSAINILENLKVTCLSDSSMGLIASALRGNSRLRTLDFIGNEGITDASMDELIEALPRSCVEHVQLLKSGVSESKQLEVRRVCNQNRLRANCWARPCITSLECAAVLRESLLNCHSVSLQKNCKTARFWQVRTKGCWLLRFSCIRMKG